MKTISAPCGATVTGVDSVALGRAYSDHITWCASPACIVESGRNRWTLGERVAGLTTAAILLVMLLGPWVGGVR